MDRGLLETNSCQAPNTPKPYTLPVAEKTYLFRVPNYGFYIEFPKKVGLLGHRYTISSESSEMSRKTAKLASGLAKSLELRMVTMMA